MSIDERDPVLERLDRIEAALESLVRQRTIKDWYSVEEFAATIGKAPYTVREHCRVGRLAAQKRRNGHELHHEWVLPHSELIRFQKEGLLPGRRQGLS
jgi:hypothetical protein